MARIDNLLTEVSDEKLRRQLLGAVADLRRRKRFGLVYEEHIPETVLLAAEAGIRVGAQVMLRKEPANKSRYTVLSVSNDQVTLSDSNSTRIENTRDLLVIKPFGEPAYPVLRPSTSPVVGSEGKPFHTIINGENFHVLQLLLFAYEGMVDCIYIDPPYNTGARDWKYNNDYVDANDAWSHSKWLSMMQKRLLLAKKLLAPNGVLMVTIDANEVHHLGVLLEEVFPGARRQVVTVCINPSGSSGEGLSRVDEYVFFLFVGNAQPSLTTDDMLSDALAEANAEDEVKVEWESLLRRGNSWYRHQRPNLCYPVYVEPSSGRITGVGEPLSGKAEKNRKRKHGKSEAAWPVRKDGKLGIWRVDSTRLTGLVEQGYAYATRRDEARGTWSLKYLMTGTISAIVAGQVTVMGRGERGEVLLRPMTRRGTTAKTMWKRGRHTAGGAGGTQLVAAQLGQRNLFSFPKSVYAVRDCLDVAMGDNREALILDFFAGSGTTLNSVAMLNRGDDGRRQCILVTNNEVEERIARELNEQGHFVGDPSFDSKGIAKAVTNPRVIAALTGLTPSGEPVQGNYLDGLEYAEGFAENAICFDMAYEDPDSIEVGEKFEAILPTLWLAAGRVGDPTRFKVDQHWFMPESIPFAVLLDEDRFQEFADALSRREDITHVWLVTDSEAAFARMRERLPRRRRIGMLYRDYLRNFRVNAESRR